MTTMTTPEERKAALANRIAQAVHRGARVESQSEYQAVVVTGRRVNHLLHFIVGVFTAGLWWIVWVIMAVTGGEKRHIIQADPYGNVLVQKV